MRIYKKFSLLLVISSWFIVTGSVRASNTQTDWPMAGADLARTSHNNVAVPGNLQVEWFHLIDPFIDPRVQVIAAAGKIFVATSKGLYAYDANTGAQVWVFGTEMPLGHSPTYANGYVYFGSYDHRLYAVDATTGVLKSGWNFVEAGAGFETSPVVTNNRVYLGNQDGNFYAFDAGTGALAWKWQDVSDPWSTAPIRDSAAYKNGILYFASDNSHAYVLQDSGATATLIWKSAKLPGTGFTGYWPVIYTDATNKDYVLFSGSKKSAWGWFHDTDGKVSYNYETDPNIGMFVGTSGCSGTLPQLDCAVISNYFAAKPEQRHFFVFDAANGSEKTNPYAPINWAGVTRGGNKYPPAVGADGLIYTYTGYENGGPNTTTGTGGWIMGWRFGTTNLSQIWDGASAGDEPVAFTTGGSLVYWGEGVNHEWFGTADVSKGVCSVGCTWDPLGPLWNIANYTSLNLGGKFGGNTGVYSYFDGVTNFSPVPYNGKLYLIVGNALEAMSVTGGSRNAGRSGIPTVTQKQSVSQTTLRQKLIQEVGKMVTAGHLRPGFYDSGITGGAMGDGYGAQIPGNYLEQYFTTPADTLITLAQALPYFDTITNPTKAQVLAYMQSEETNYPVETITNIGWKNGAKREIYYDTSEMTKAFNTSESNCSNNPEVATIPTQCWRQYNELKIIPPNTSSFLLPEAFYAAWKYALAQGFSPAQALTLFNKMKSKLPVAGVNNDMTDANLLNYPYIHNEYLIGYRGYVELDKLANNLADISGSTQYPEYQRLLNLRLNNFTENAPWDGSFNYVNAMNVARNFMYMTPELGSTLKAKQAAVQTAIDHYQTLTPYWFVGKYPRTYGEAIFQPLYDRAALFQAKAYILNAPQSELVKYLDVPAYQVGDLFYIQNLVAALQAPSTSVPGDANGDGIVNILDIKYELNSWFSSFNSLDFGLTYAHL